MKKNSLLCQIDVTEGTEYEVETEEAKIDVAGTKESHASIYNEDIAILSASIGR
jgi:hypothetical protein